MPVAEFTPEHLESYYQSELHRLRKVAGRDGIPIPHLKATWIPSNPYLNRKPFADGKPPYFDAPMVVLLS
jgi:hypothetical protein